MRKQKYNEMVLSFTKMIIQTFFVLANYNANSNDGIV